ncbi:cytochrome P450 4C1-like [Leptopilina heterotoma]|uniref:cytochrome P450 4C1-like n=1 Tax=Leptopilina heterotoma TaxID=63436 RepID=UPI001CA85C30|nr:cytochrome P450 4C1-like [Leptopilina heterotoma]
MSALGIFVVSIIIISLHKFIPRLIKFMKFSLMINKIPGPAPFPIPYVGLLGWKIKAEDRIIWFGNIHKKFKKGVMQIAIFLDAYIFINKPRQMEVILPKIETSTKADLYNAIDLWLGGGLLTSSGEKWFQNRKHLTPAFHFGVVEQFMKTMSEKAEILVQCIENEIMENGGKTIDFHKHSVRCALDIICETSMGANMDVQRNHDIPYIKALEVLLVAFGKRIYYPWLKWDWLFYLTKSGRDFKKSAEIMKHFTIGIIKKRRQLRNTENPVENRDEFGKRQKKAFLDLMLDLDQNEKYFMTDEDIKAQVDTFMFAGHDTTASAINWAIFNLGNNLEVQVKVHEELDAVFGDSKEPASVQQIAELTYLERVIKENLRLYPSVPVIGRLLTENTELDGYTLPKGTNVTLNIFALHRDPESWTNPDEFDPDRFLPENCQKRHPYAYIPFSAGPRNCIGMKFAMAEQKIVLTAILRKWRVKSLRSTEEMKYQAHMILCPHNGNPVYFLPRDK